MDKDIAKVVSILDGLEEDASPVLTDAQLSRISMLGIQLVSLEADIKTLEAQVAAKKADHFKMSTETIPLAMDEVELAQFVLQDGFAIKVEPFIQGSLPLVDPKKPESQAKHDEAIGWFRENGHEGIIRREVSLSFKKGQDALAEKVLASLYAIPELPMCGVEVSDEQNVHHMTLKSWAKEMQAENLEFPAAKLGLFIGRHTKVTKVG